MEDLAAWSHPPPSRGVVVIPLNVDAGGRVPQHLDRKNQIMERGPDAADENGNRPNTEPAADSPRRLGNPTRLVPRQPPPEEPEDPVSAAPYPAVFEDELESPGRAPVFGRGGLGPMFGPRSFGSGRVQVWGCSPGCLIVSLIASALLTLLLNAMF